MAIRRLLDDFLSVDEAILEIDGRRERRLSLERGDAAAAIVRRRDDGAILLTRQFRYSTHAKGPGWMVEAAAGIVSDGESPSASIRRELVEELGYEAEHLEPIASFYPSPGASSERVHLFYAEVSESSRVAPGGGLAEEGEVIETVVCELSELERQLLSDELNDAKTIIAVQWLLAARSIRTRGA